MRQLPSAKVEVLISYRGSCDGSFEGEARREEERRGEGEEEEKGEESKSTFILQQKIQ